jgi:dTMP kinase
MKKNIYPGKFIVIEGLDGSGQSTETAFLRDFLIEKDYKVLTTKEPTVISEAGRRIKQVLEEKEEISSLELQKLFVEDRKYHLDNIIIPSLKDGKIVISDRYFFSTFAYGVSDGIDLKLLIEMNNDFLIPDLIFFLNVNQDICIKRIEKRGNKKTLFEKKEKLKKVYENYKKIIKNFENVYSINGELLPDKVFEEIKQYVEKKCF